MVILGIILILIGSYLSIFIGKIEIVKYYLEFVPSIVPAEFVVNSVIFVLMYVFYFMFEKIKNKKLIDDIETINVELNNFLLDGVFSVEKSNSPFLYQTVILLNKLVTKYQNLKEKTTKEINQLEEVVESLEDMIDLQNTLVCKVNESGKVVKANKRFLKFLALKNEVDLNMKFKNIREIFDNELSEAWLNDFLHKENFVSIKGVKFFIKVEKVEREQNYVLSLVDITRFQEEKEELERKILYTNHNLKTELAINKTLESLMIRVINYENYATHLGRGILEVFEEKFVERIESLGYKDIFKIQNDIFVVYDKKVNFEKIQKLLEETMKIGVGGDKYIFNPKVVLASGVNFEQSYQQILESTTTLISKEKDEVKYHLEIIKLVNKAIINSDIVLGYQVIEGQNKTIIIVPCIKDDYGSSLIDNKLTTNIAREFNLYLIMIKQLLINNINLLKNYHIVINVTSQDLLSSTILSDLLSLIGREELKITFNVDINSKYSLVLPILKQIKSSAQLGFRNIGKGYVNFKDMYVLKIEFLEIDESITDLIKTNPQWKFLLDSVKLLVSAQKTKLLAKGYKDDKVFRIIKDLKTYEN